ncbi:MAG: hypothetical protein FWD40_03005 [Treponema sp.]|nr:hypothetical protein [Treponema sp.]
MSFFRSVLLASLISLLAALGLLYLGFSMGYEEFKGGYAVLTLDSSIEGRPVRSILETGLIFGGEPICESSQWVMLDVFDSLEKIPLDEYSKRIFPFDPRNDGYADKLRNIFVRDEKRFIYIPIIAGNWNSNLLNRMFSDLLGDISFSVDYYGIGRPLSLFFIVYAAASAILLLLCYIKRKAHRSIVNIIPMIPVLSSLGFFGAAGIGCAALLFGLFILIKEPLADLVNSSAKGFGQRINQIIKDIILPYRYYWLFLPFFIIAFAVLVIFSQLKLLFLIAVSAASFAVFFFSLKIVIFSGVEHKRFNPVTIVKRRFPEFVFSWYILPFVAGVFLTLYFTPYMSGTYDSKNKFDALISEQDYYAHLAYQASFSTRQMSDSAEQNNHAVFPDFFFDSDGLPSMSIASANQNFKTGDYPAFPLKYLMEFFNTVNNEEKTDVNWNAGSITERVSLLILILFLLPGFIIKKKDNNAKINYDGLKRFTGKQRLAGINRNNKQLYNGSMSCNLKDA